MTIYHWPPTQKWQKGVQGAGRNFHCGNLFCSKMLPSSRQIEWADTGEIACPHIWRRSSGFWLQSLHDGGEMPYCDTQYRVKCAVKTELSVRASWAGEMIFRSCTTIGLDAVGKLGPSWHWKGSLPCARRDDMRLVGGKGLRRISAATFCPICRTDGEKIKRVKLHSA